jgi:acyl carrier protein
MTDTAVLSRDEILEKTRSVLMEALVVDAEEVTPEASLTADLQAESIDFLDIVFRLEKEFSTPDKPFKIQQGELFPDNLLENPDWVHDGKFTDEGMTMLKERMPHVDFSDFEQDRELEKVGATITVSAMVEFVERKLTA